MMTMSALQIKIKCKIKGSLVSEKTVNLLKCLQASYTEWRQLHVLSGGNSAKQLLLSSHRDVGCIPAFFPPPRDFVVHE